MQTENIFFNLSAISENFEGEIGGFQPKNEGNPKHFWKKGWAYRFLLDASEVRDC